MTWMAMPCDEAKRRGLEGYSFSDEYNTVALAAKWNRCGILASGVHCKRFTWGHDGCVAWVPDTTPAQPLSDLKDLKAALVPGVKPDLTHVRGPLMAYVARACEYGCDKYQRANYLRPTTGGMAADVQRLRAYLASVVRHVISALDTLERLESASPAFAAAPAALTEAAYAPDAESGLPHLAHAAAGLQMAIVQAVDAGLLPADPGTPWRKP